MRGSNPLPRSGMFVFYLLNLFRVFCSRGGTRTRTDISVQGILSPPWLPLHPSAIYHFLQYKYNKKFWNFQIFLLFFAIFCAYSWIRTNALPYPYGRFLCLSGLTDSISNISRHYFDSSIVSCSVYASNLYRQIIVLPTGLEPVTPWLWVRCYWPTELQEQYFLKEL